MARKKLLTEGEIRQFMKLANLRPIGSGRLSEMGYAGQRDEDPMAMGDEMPPEEGAPEDPMAGEEADMELDAEMGPEPAGGDGQMVSMDDFMSALERAIEEVTGEEADVSEAPGEEEAGLEGEEGLEDLEMGAPEGAEEEEELMEVHYGFGSGARREPKMKAPKRTEKEEKESKGKGEKGFGKPYEKEEKEEKEDLEEVHYGFGSGARREPKMKAPRRTGPAMGFGEPDPEEEEESEMLPGIPYDPEEEGERARRRRRKKGHGYESPSGGIGMPAMGMEEHVVNEVAKRVAARLRAESRKEQVVDQIAERIMKRFTK